MNRILLSVASLAVLAWVGLLGSVAVQAQIKYTPESPEVEAMVRKGLAYLRTTQVGDIGPLTLKALAICEASLRYDGERLPEQDESVQKAIAASINYIHGDKDKMTMYATGVCAIYLSLFDDRYKDELQTALDFVEKRQQSGGGWGYESDGDRDYGDTSQMQYCCLAMWVAKKVGLRPKTAVAQAALNWLFDTQTGAGGWHYRASRGGGGNRGGGIGAGGGGGSGGETLSLAAAGGGSVYMLTDILGVGSSLPKGSKVRRVGGDLPIIIREYVANEDESAADQPKDSALVNGAQLRNCTNAVNRWFKDNFKPNADEWRYYYLYGFERYAYFRETMEGQVTEHPDWYDQGVDFLMREQNANGSWQGGSEPVTPAVSTVFAILFLVRSTEILANDPHTGVYSGGQGFANGNLTVRNGQVIGEAVTRDVEDFLRAIDSDKDVDLKQFEESLVDLQVSKDPAKRAQHLQQLRVLVSDEDFDKRYIAVKALSRIRDLDNVPVLIYALTDPSSDVIVQAQKGLRFISRKIDSIQLPQNPTADNCKFIKKQWEDWYRSIRPDAEFLYEEDK